MSLAVLLNGVQFTRALSISVNRSMRQLVGYAEVTVTEPEAGQVPAKLGDAFEVIRLEDRSRLLKGFVERIRANNGTDSHELSFSGRDITCDLLDSSLKVKTYQGPISFPDLLSQVLQNQGLSYTVLNKAGSLKQIKKEELVAGEIGQPAMEFIETYARKVSVVMTTTENGEILLTKAGAETSGLSLVCQPFGKLNNILESSVEWNDTERYKDYTCQVQISNAGLDQDFEPKDTVTQSGTATDTTIKRARFYEFEAETTMNAVDAADRAKLESNVRRARGLTYTAVVQGAPPQIKINRLIQINDEILGIRATLLIDTVDHRFDLSAGTSTQITCTYKDAYSLEAQVDELSKSRDDTEEKRRPF